MAELIGHQHILNYLKNALAHGKLNQAYLLHGPASIGKIKLVRTFLPHLFCPETKKNPCLNCAVCKQIENGNHPDLHWVKRENDARDITIDQVRRIKDFTSLTSTFVGGWRTVVLENAHELNDQAANALLKVLEEPLARTIFFLTTSRLKEVLPTIRSRSQTLALTNVSIAEIAEALLKRGVGEQAHVIAHSSSGLPGRALYLSLDNNFAERENKFVEKFLIFLSRTTWVELQAFINEELVEDNEITSIWDMAESIIDLWLAASRDILLMKIGLPGFIRNEIFKNKLQSIAQSKQVFEIFAIIKTLMFAQKKLAARANVKLTFEWLGFHLFRLV